MSSTFQLVSPDGSSDFIRGNMDLTISPRGTPVMVSGVDVSAQAFAKGLLTGTGSNPLAPNYGTRARDLIGSKMLGNVMAGMLAQMAETHLRYLATQQSVRATQIDIPPSEQIVGLKSIAVTFAAQGSMIVEATVQTRSGDQAVLMTTGGGSV